MKHLSIVFLIVLSFLRPLPISAQNQLLWDEVPDPRILSLEPTKNDPTRIVLSFEGDLSTRGADRAVVSLEDSKGKALETKIVGRTNRPVKTVEFTPPGSGVYQFSVSLYRKGEEKPKRSGTVTYNYRFPLRIPPLKLLNQGKGTLLVRWQPVQEAEAYQVLYREIDYSETVPPSLEVLDGKTKTTARIQSESGTMECLLERLSVGKRYAIALSVHRGDERVCSVPRVKTIRDTQDREWSFTWFGQSTRPELNTFTMLDEDAFIFQLRSCSYDPSTNQIIAKGGKFTTFHDGISFYYTVLDPKTENFELTATFQIDYINPTPDGQEGFGLLVLDSLGQHGVNSVNHYTNSAGIIATKFEEVVGGVKKTSKDTLGARFVTCITKEIIALGDSGIAQQGRSVSKAFSYDFSSLIQTGESYRITLKKTNTGYHAIYRNPYSTEEDRTEFILYGPEKLQVLDPDHIYVGFAVARGCNVTVKDVVFTTHDARTDPPGIPEPPEVVPLIAKVDSPTTYSKDLYPFVFYANSDGFLTVRDAEGKEPVKNVPIKEYQDFRTILKLQRGRNDYTIQFTPDSDFKPGPNKVVGRYYYPTGKYVEDYSPYTLNLSVLYHFYDGEELFVSPQGSPLGKGTLQDPLDITTALFFVKEGQKILLKGGVYYPSRTIQIERGNDGAPGRYKTLTSMQGERAILDFSTSEAKSAGFILGGSHWIIENIDIRNTPGDVKGFQIAGNNNIIRDVRAYTCGDTGLQISGVSTEPRQKWPQHNQIIRCLSHDNQDPASNNADGFAAKLTAGDGNLFRDCIAHHNIDDGWDLYTKIETGPIGLVLIENCVSYMNGFRSDGTGNGDGNGFKLGGDGIAVPHILRNCIAFGNGTSGITSNSNPAVIIENCTSYGNQGPNVILYGKGEGKREFVVRNLLSFGGGAGDVYREMPELAAPHNFFWNGAACVNSEGRTLSKEAFVSTDFTVQPYWNERGRIDLNGFLTPTLQVPAGIGARFE